MPLEPNLARYVRINYHGGLTALTVGHQTLGHMVSRRYSIELLDSKKKTWIKAMFFLTESYELNLYAVTCDVHVHYQSIAIHSTIP